MQTVVPAFGSDGGDEPTTRCTRYFASPDPGVGSIASGQFKEIEPSGLAVALAELRAGAIVSKVTDTGLEISPVWVSFTACTA